jgi:hypothetical protein
MLTKIKQNLLLIFTLILQASCGFNPAYKTDRNQENCLSAIEISPIETIEGIDFYNHIKNLLPSEGNTRYVLNTTLSFSRSYNILQSNSDIFREVQNIKVTYQLIDKQSLKIINTGSFVKMDSYSVNSSLYSNAVLRQDAMSVLAENAAEEIRNRLVMFFIKR